MEQEETGLAVMPAAPMATSATGLMVSSRQAQEVQAAMVVAQKCPRDETQAYKRIMEACKRTGLAEKASYAYPRGGKMVTGPSIRLAETMARAWGNIDTGMVELENKPGKGSIPGESLMLVYAWDLETNYRSHKTFTVRHKRDTKGGGNLLTDERDIYEIAANMGARRLRSCILAVIPADITEEATKQCKKTLAGGSKVPLADRIRGMVVAFAEYGISQDVIEKRLMHKIDATMEEELVTLRQIHTSLMDGMSKREDWFEIAPAGTTDPIAEQNAADAAAEDPPPKTQSVRKKSATKVQEKANSVGPQGPEMDREGTLGFKDATTTYPQKPVVNPGPKNMATPEGIAELKAQAEAKKAVAAAEPAFDVPADQPENGPDGIDTKPPTFKELWTEVAGVCKQYGWDPQKLADFCKQKLGKSPAELQRTDDIKSLTNLYTMLLQVERDV